MPFLDASIWIVHRDPGPRGALGRLAGPRGALRVRHEIVLGRAEDAVFDSARRPDVVVLDVSASPLDPEPELEFARRIQGRNPEAAWLLVADPAHLDATRRLFDALDATVITAPPDARTLRGALETALDRTRTLPLSRRIGRDHVSARFVRWFSSSQGLGEPPELALALDPRLSREPVLARGERGTGRGLLLRYVHEISTPDLGPFVRVSCSARTRPDQLVSQIEDGVREAGRADGRFGIWLEGIDLLAPSVQTHVLDWIDFGLPCALPASLRAGTRWFASTGVDLVSLDARLSQAFSELTIWTLPLRERPGVIDAFVTDTARAWSSARREPAKTFDPPALDMLRDEPWPGNLAELEAVVIRSLAHAPADAETIRIVDLRFDSDLGPLAGSAAEDSTRVVAEEPPASSASAPEETQTPTLQTPLQTPLPPTLQTTPESPPESTGAGATDPADPASIARLAGAVAHEVRNPLVSIRTFSELLHDHYADAEFRTRFGALVAADIRRIEDVVERLEQIGESPPERPTTPIDMTALLEGLLDEQRANIQSKRLLVLKELDRAQPMALGDEAALRGAIAGLLDHAIEEVPERGDLYLASRHHPGPADSPSQGIMRILLRYRVRPGRTDLALETLDGTDLRRSAAEEVIRSQGGSLVFDTSDAQETLITIDLPASGRSQG
jgi:DNA-binding NtrC family response regulator